jgi:hypothetical protein
MTNQTQVQHTPGPWTYSGMSAGAPLAIMDSVGMQQVAQVAHRWSLDGEYITPTEADANARLIASAPDLLAALASVCVAFEEGEDVLPMAGAIDAVIRAGSNACGSFEAWQGVFRAERRRARGED